MSDKSVPPQGESQPGSQEAQRLQAESSKSHSSSGPGSTPDNAES